MSARRRGQARGNAPDTSNPQARRGPNPARGRVAPFDGPASRGSGSGGGAQSRTPAPPAPPAQPSSNPPSRPGSDAGQSQSSAQAASQPTQQVAPPIARDPALDRPVARATDSIKNIDMPASFYNIDGLVSYILVPLSCIKNPLHRNLLQEVFLPVRACFFCVPQSVSALRVAQPRRMSCLMCCLDICNDVLVEHRDFTTLAATVVHESSFKACC